MDRGRLPPNSDLYQEDGLWKLRWRDDSTESEGGQTRQWREPAWIGPAIGPEGLTENQARQSSWKFFQSLQRRNTRARQSEMTVAEFVETKFAPEHVAIKSSSGRAHYRAILKHVLTPEMVDHLFLMEAENPKAKLKTVPDWPYLDNLRLCDAKPDHVQRLISAALERGYSTQTVKHIRSVISTIFAHARQEECLAGENPARSAKLPGMTRKVAHVLTAAQVKDVLQVMKSPEKEVALIAILTGMNVAEISGMQWKRVNLTDTEQNADGESIPPHAIAVRMQWYRGELEGVMKSRNRNVPIPRPLLPILLTLSRRAKFTGPDDFVLVSRVGTPINQTNIVARRFKTIGKELEMPWLSWHVFRRAHSASESGFGKRFQNHIARMTNSDPGQNTAIEVNARGVEPELPY